jgi:hypothetical protein
MRKTKSATGSTSSSPALDRKALFYMFLLALQFGVQPVLTRRYTPPGITSSTVILAQEVVKFGIAFFMLRVSGSTSEAISGKLKSSFFDTLSLCCHLRRRLTLFMLKLLI